MKKSQYEYRKILDNVLNRIVERGIEVDHFKAITDTFGEGPTFKEKLIADLIKNDKIDAVVSRAIFEKLFQDGFITTTDALMPTFKGILFEGYVKKASRKFRNDLWKTFLKIVAVVSFLILLYNTFGIKVIQERLRQQQPQKASAIEIPKTTDSISKKHF